LQQYSIFTKKMDARVKPAHDDGESGRAAYRKIPKIPLKGEGGGGRQFCGGGR
jgi:hypothetical protein